MFIELWQKKFDVEVRKIVAGDIDCDGLDEIAVASWDSRLHIIDNDGKILWSTREQEYPAENVEIIYDSLNHPISIIGTFHKNIIAFGLKGKKIWRTTLDSWILQTTKISAEVCGIEKIIAVDLKGSIYLIDDTGEVLWKIENIVLPQTNNTAILKDKIYVGDREGSIKIYSLDGKEISKNKVSDSPILSLDAISITNTDKIIAVGHKKGVSILTEDLKKIQSIRLKSQQDFRVTKICNIDNTGDNIYLLAGAWIGDKINLMHFSKEKNKFIVTRQFRLDGNPIGAYCSDINGNLVKELFFIDDTGKTYLLRDPSDQLVELEMENSIHGLTFANTQGFGQKDLITKTTKESVSCLAFVPRVHTELDDSNKGKILIMAPARSKISVDPIIKIDSSKKKLSRKSYNKRSITFYEIPFNVLFRGKIAKAKISRSKSILLEAPILIPKVQEIDSFTEVISLAEEDIINIIDIKTTSKKFCFTTSNVKVNHYMLKDKKLQLHITIEYANQEPFKAQLAIEKCKDTTPEQKRIATYDFWVVPLKTLNIKITYENIMTTGENIEILLKNNSAKKIPVTIRINRLSDKDQTFIINSKEKRHISIPIKIHEGKTRIDIKDVLTIEYGEHIRRKLSIPIKLTVLNTPLIKQHAQKIYDTTKDKDVVINTLSEELKIPKEKIKHILGY